MIGAKAGNKCVGFQLWIFLLGRFDLLPYLGKTLAGVLVQRDRHDGKVCCHKGVDACHVDVRGAVHNNEFKHTFIFRKVAAQTLIAPAGRVQQQGNVRPHKAVVTGQNTKMLVRLSVGVQGRKRSMKGAGISGSLGRQHIAQTVGKIVDVVELGAVALLIGIN